MKPRDYIISQIQHKETRPVPYTFPLEKSVKDKIDKFYGTSDWMKSIKKYMNHPLRVDTLQEKTLIDKYSIDAFGSIWRNYKRPWHLEKPVLQECSFSDFKFPPLSQFTDPIYINMEKAIKSVKEDKESFHVISMGWGLFEQTWRIMGFENALMNMALEPEFYSELIGRITELYVGMVKACSELPADAFMFGDDWGDQRGIIFGAERWGKFIKPCWKMVYDEVHKQNKYVMSHSCGSIAEILDDAIEIGLDVYESVQPEGANMNPFELKKKYGDRITFWGCLGSQSIIPFGTPDEIKFKIRELCREVGRGGGFIIAPAKPLQPETPVENAIAILEAFNSQDEI